MKNLLIFLGICLIISITSCKKDMQDEQTKEPAVSCPSVSNDISWQDGGSYGDWNLEKEGADGWSIGTKLNLVSSCGLKIVGNETGGYGNTYAVASDTAAFILRWKYNTFAEYVVSSKWTGKTKDKNISMGCILSDFLKAYPSFVKDATNAKLYVISGTPSVKAFFSDATPNAGHLTKIIVNTR